MRVAPPARRAGARRETSLFEPFAGEGVEYAFNYSSIDATLSRSHPGKSLPSLQAAGTRCSRQLRAECNKAFFARILR